MTSVLSITYTGSKAAGLFIVRVYMYRLFALQPVVDEKARSSFIDPTRVGKSLNF